MTPSTSVWGRRSKLALEVYLLGLVELDSALELQQRFVEGFRDRDEHRSALLLCEHPPSVTVGRETPRDWLANIPPELGARRVPLKWTNRGGGCVVHGPGQLAAYPVVSLAQQGWGVVEFRSRIQRALISVCSDLGVPAWCHESSADIWCRGGRIAEVGLAVQSGISSHGIFLNVAPWQDWLMRIRRQLAGREVVTSLSAQRTRQTAMPAVREALIRRLAGELSLTFHLFSSHPLLRRTRNLIACP